MIASFSRKNVPYPGLVKLALSSILTGSTPHPQQCDLKTPHEALLSMAKQQGWMH